MSFHSILRDVSDGFLSLSRRSFEASLFSHCRGGSQGVDYKMNDQEPVDQDNGWASLPHELFHDVIERLEVNEGTWPLDKDVIACASVCRAWRKMCKEMVGSPEFCGKLTFPVSLKQPGPRDGTIQCFIKRDKSKLTYQLYLSLNPAACDENGKFLLSAKRTRRAVCKEYKISTSTDNTSLSSNNHFGKLRSNFIGKKFTLYGTQTPNAADATQTGKTSRRFYSKKVSHQAPADSYKIAKITYSGIGKSGPRDMQCTMHSIPKSVLQNISSRSLDDSFSSASFSKSSVFSSSRFSDFSEASHKVDCSRFSRVLADAEEEPKEWPLVLRSKCPRWHWHLQAWCLNFHGRVKLASVKNFQLIDADYQVPASSKPEDFEKEQVECENNIILQFGRVSKDVYTMDYRYPLSAFEAFAICLTTFDTKLGVD